MAQITVVGSRCWIVIASCPRGLKAKNGWSTPEPAGCPMEVSRPLPTLVRVGFYVNNVADC